MMTKLFDIMKIFDRRWLFVALAVVCLGVVTVVLLEAEDTVDVSRRATPPAAPVVSVLSLDLADRTAQISLFSELRPRWTADIRAVVSGRILSVHEAALAGTRVAQGTPLFEIERSPYQTAVAAAELALEEATLSRLRAENKVTVARKQFERDGLQPPNDLAVHLPELRIAERAVASASAQLAAARKQLADTTVTAPFSGFVTARHASLGQTVSAGEGLLSLSDDRHYELIAELSQDDWALLKHPIAGAEARVFHRDGRGLGVARIRQGGGFLDPKTRQMRIFLDVSDPADGLLAGDFVRVTFEGRILADTLTVPEAALSNAGYIWLVDHTDHLVRHMPRILFRDHGMVTIAAPDDLPDPQGRGPWRVAKTPLASFLPGQRVTPIVGED